MKVLVTGGCGFIGSNFIKYLLTSPEIQENIELINLDKQTYAGQGKNIEHLNLNQDSRYSFILADIADKNLINYIFQKEKPEIVFNFAAESHVDRSIENSNDFILSNFLGSINLADCARKSPVKKFIQISTDEVYGSIENGSFDETAKLTPTNPYSASKAAAELQLLSYFKTYKFPLIITRSANNYGPYQFPEKLLPLFITNLLDNKKVPLMWSDENPGLNIRDWLNVEDNCRAIWFVSKNGDIGETYNIPGENEKTNIEVTKKLLKNLGYGEEMIEKVQHRKSHDFRYSINGEKIKKLGFNHIKHFEDELANLITWYRNNENWWRPLKK
jgi:dTDP-glucose 4,6-dehydratase